MALASTAHFQGQTRANQKTRYEAPKALKIGTAQELLQGCWTYATYKDAWGSYYTYN